MRLSVKRRRIGKKARKNRGLLRDNRSPTEPTGASQENHESQVAKNKGNDEHRLRAG
jgi:hypothetical protein